MNSLYNLAASAAYVPPQEDEEMEEEEEIHEEEAPKKTKKSKKVTKKSKSSKSSKRSSDDGNTVRLKDLAKQAKLTESVARKKLRDADITRGEGRWAWDQGSKALRQARKALGLSV